MARDPWRMPFEIAGYRFLGLIGRGGMGTIYRAQQIGMDRPVAVKILRPDLAENGVYVERLKREARVAGRLDHVHIVKGIEVGEADGRHYFVMEFVEGKSLKTILKEQGTLDEEEVIELGLQIARGLQHAHREGVVHRDIKPSNILVSSSGVGKLADLGLARRAEDPSLTQDGATVGTPQYMAPEQATDSGRADPRSDLYSLGATLFHAATGRPPYEAEAIGPLLTKLLHEPVPDPLAFQPDLSQGLALVLRKALAKNPAERYSTATELIADLLRVRNHLPPRVPLDHDDHGRTSRFGLRLVVVAACVVLLSVALLVILTREVEPDPEPRPPETPAVLRELVQLELAVAASPAEPRWLDEIVALGRRLGTLPESNPEARRAAVARVNQLHGQVVAALSTRLDQAQAAFLDRARERLAEDPFANGVEQELFETAWPAAVEAQFPGPRPLGLVDLVTVRERELREGFRAQREVARHQWLQNELREAERLFEDPRMESALAYGRFEDADQLLRGRREELERKFTEVLAPEARMAAIEALDPLIRAQRDRLRDVARERVTHLIEEMRRRKRSLEDSATPDRAQRFARFYTFLEDLGLDSPDQLPGALRTVPETNPFVVRDRLRAELEELDAIDRDRNSQDRWERIIRGYVDARAAERRYAVALDYLAISAEEITEPAVREHVKDRRRAIERLQDLVDDVARTFDAAHERKERVALLLRDGTTSSGVPRGPFDRAAMVFPVGRGEDGVPYRQVAAKGLLELARPALEARGEDPVELGLLLAFYDALDTPAIGEVFEATAALEPGPFKVMVQAWARTAHEAYQSLSGDAVAEIRAGLDGARALAARGEFAAALAALQGLEESPRMQAPGLRNRFGKDVSDLTALWRRLLQQDDIRKEIERAIPGAVVELRAGETAEEDLYSVVLDLSQRSVLGGLRAAGARDLKGWDVDERGFYRLEEAKKLRDLAKGPGFDLRFGIYSFDFRHPVSMEMAVTCPEEEGIPFFFAAIAGSWTFGFLTGGVSPDFQHAEFHLVEAAAVGRRGGRAFAMPGTSLDSLRGKLPARHEKGPQGRSVPFGGFLRGVTHRVRIDLLDSGKRVQLSLDSELLIDAPAQTRLRDRVEFRAWDRVRVRELRVSGRLK